MVVALKEVKIRGEIRTTVDYCVEMIQSPDFVGNNIHTGWLDARISSHVSATLSALLTLQIPCGDGLLTRGPVLLMMSASIGYSPPYTRSSWIFQDSAYHLIL